MPVQTTPDSTLSSGITRQALAVEREALAVEGEAGALEAEVGVFRAVPPPIAQNAPVELAAPAAPPAPDDAGSDDDDTSLDEMETAASDLVGASQDAMNAYPPKTPEYDLADSVLTQAKTILHSIRRITVGGVTAAQTGTGPGSS